MKTKKLTRAKKEELGLKKPMASKYELRKAQQRTTATKALDELLEPKS